MTNLEFFLTNGCVHAILGKSKIPEGYSILVDKDGYTFWVGPNGEEGVMDWNKWRSLKRAKLHASREQEHP